MNLHPIGIATTPPGRTACARCGLPTSGDTETFDVLGRVVGDRIDVMTAKVTFGMCASCRDRDEHAQRLVAEHPRIRQAVGSPARHQVAGALDALAVLDVAPPQRLTDQRIHELLRLAPVGIASRWSSLYSPIWTEGASTKQCASEPWLFVSIEARNEARHLYADFTADGLPPVAVPSPTGGCAWCGVGSVLARRSQKRTAWTPHGGRHLCPTCAAINDSGDGPEVSLWAALDPDRTIRRQFSQRPTLNGAALWAEVRGTPNATPWDHLDLDTLRRKWASYAEKSKVRMVYINAEDSVN